jgi:cell division protein FtsW
MSAQPHAFARTDRSKLGMWWWTTDRWLLGAAAALVFLGVMLSFASSPAATARMGVEDPFYFAMRQCVFAGMAVAVLLSVSMLSPRGVRRVAFCVWIGAILCMMALPFIGHSAKGARAGSHWARSRSSRRVREARPGRALLLDVLRKPERGGRAGGQHRLRASTPLTIGLLLIQPDIGKAC